MNRETSPRFGKTDLRKLGTYLRSRRLAADLTLRHLSELSSVSTAALRSLEGGKASPSLISVLNVVDALGLTIDEAIDGALRVGQRVLVTRQGTEAGEDPAISEFALSVRIVSLDPGELLSLPPSLRAAPSLGVLLEGAVIVSQEGAHRVRLFREDAYHAKPGSVAAWANAGDDVARLLCVTDTRQVGKSTESERQK